MDVTVATKDLVISNGQQISHAFPVVRFEQVSWSRCFLLVNLGKALTFQERELVPNKTMVIEWDFTADPPAQVEANVQRRLSGLLSILARSDVSI